VQYFYDDVGRLIRVVDGSGNVATYAYDAVGNLLSISRSSVPANNGLAILSFSPQSGTAGQTVIMQGQGFNTTASANSVQFNGVGTAVATATTNTLTVTVPAGATTGPISVTVGYNVLIDHSHPADHDYHYGKRLSIWGASNR
jgi:YD repeat-containing protein